MGIWSPPPPLLPFSYVDWLGCASEGPNHRRDMDEGETQSLYQLLGDEGNSVGFECLQTSDHGKVCGLDKQQYYSCDTPKEQSTVSK